MSSLSKLVVAAVLFATIVQVTPQDAPSPPSNDPCAAIGPNKWVSPQEVRACFTSFSLDENIRNNVIDVINKTLAFHTSTNYQIRAPEPFSREVRVDVPRELARIKRQHYSSEYEFHVDVSRTLKRLNDGHAVWTFGCYDSLYHNFLPTPLSLLTGADGVQHVHISPEAFTVASAEFPDQIEVWQNALPGPLRGNLSSLSGARVLSINGRPPFDAVNANALITGSYQGFGTRQNAFFSSYSRGRDGWNYAMGNFAQQSLPLADSVRLTILRRDRTRPETIVLPYRSRFNPSAKAFTDTASWRERNCVAQPGTNGVNANADDAESRNAAAQDPNARFQQQPFVPPAVAAKHPLNVLIDSSPLTNVALPEPLQPSLAPVNGSASVGQFYMLKDGKTGVLALGSFSDADFNNLQRNLLVGLMSLRSLGATQLIVDVTNNGGGFICVAHWLHRIIAGPKSSTEPQAGLYTKARAGPLAQLIVEEIISKPSLDQYQFLSYSPRNWRSADNAPFNSTTNWLQPVVEKVINRRPDAFSPRLGQECQPGGFAYEPPQDPLFDTTKVVIVSNGRCASSCSLFSISMAKYEGSKTVVYGGKADVQQHYCGTVGGQSTNFRGMDTEVKTTNLKGNSLAPPDLLVNGGQGITWRLAFGVDNPEEPAEWQYYPADVSLPITAELVNNPVAIWEEVRTRLLS